MVKTERSRRLHSVNYYKKSIMKVPDVSTSFLVTVRMTLQSVEMLYVRRFERKEAS